MVFHMTLLETRKQYGVTQLEVSSLLNVPVRTYIRYEQDDNYGNPLKREMMIASINKKYEITENKGILTIEQIRTSLVSLFEKQKRGTIEFCYLFGSYAKGYATEKSDVDLCVATDLTGLNFVGLSEDIRSVLHKKIDLIRFNNLKDNLELISEILKDGIKIYGQPKN